MKQKRLTRRLERAFAAASRRADTAYMLRPLLPLPLPSSRLLLQRLHGTTSGAHTVNFDVESVLSSGVTGLRPIILIHGNCGGQ